MYRVIFPASTVQRLACVYGLPVLNLVNNTQESMGADETTCVW